jgi:hypothetical protein
LYLAVIHKQLRRKPVVNAAWIVEDYVIEILLHGGIGNPFPLCSHHPMHGFSHTTPIHQDERVFILSYLLLRLLG